ncbi:MULTISPECIES: hypothetical protein [unclassified Exiguobacterium]|uniref:hypothetical protein n=1 Tax=unclassified Exiguobacterium TaxID=2644629 RepID=UPI001BE586C6|nr:MULTISPECIES: hypothetical protein [unclassified Exiguobacterium]MDT0192797.1 hypothetical protein [Exiguobacterium sp. BG5(2022)]
MKKYLIFSTLVILFFLFGCEEERALRLQPAPEYYQGRALLPNGQQIEMPESDRAAIIELCQPDNAIQRIPSGERHWLGTVTLNQPLTDAATESSFPTATFFTVENKSYVQCQLDSVTYATEINTLPESLNDVQYTAEPYPDVPKFRFAEPHEYEHFAQEMKKPIGNEPYPERKGIEHTLFHITMPFSGEFELTFTSSEAKDRLVIPVESIRHPYLSLGLGTEKSDEVLQYAIYTSRDQNDYQEVLRPKEAHISQMFGAKTAPQLPSVLVPGHEYPLYSFTFMKNGTAHRQNVSLTYHEPKLLYGKELGEQIHDKLSSQRHVIFHDLALLGTESKDASFLQHVGQDEMEFIFGAIKRANATAYAGKTASTPYVTLFQGICAQTFDVSYDGADVYVTNSETGAHFKLLREDAIKWYNLFEQNT